MYYLDRRQKRPLNKFAIKTLYAILMLFAWSFDQFATFSIKIFSSAGYHLSGQVKEASLRQSDSLIALYPFCFLFRSDRPVCHLVGRKWI